MTNYALKINTDKVLWSAGYRGTKNGMTIVFPDSWYIIRFKSMLNENHVKKWSIERMSNLHPERGYSVTVQNQRIRYK